MYGWRSKGRLEIDLLVDRNSMLSIRVGCPDCGIRTRRRSAGSRTSVFVSTSPGQDAAAIDVEVGREKRSPVKVGFLLLQAGFNFWPFRDRSTRFAFDNFCQHVDHGRPVFDDQGVARFIGNDTAFR